MTRGVVVATEDNGNNGWDLPTPPTAGVTAMDTALPQSPPTDDGDNYDNKDGGQRDKKGVRMTQGIVVTMKDNNHNRWDLPPPPLQPAQRQGMQQ